jgi:hypothetical protein
LECADTGRVVITIVIGDGCGPGILGFVSMIATYCQYTVCVSLSLWHTIRRILVGVVSSCGGAGAGHPHRKGAGGRQVRRKKVKRCVCPS